MEKGFIFAFSLTAWIFGGVVENCVLVFPSNQMGIDLLFRMILGVLSSKEKKLEIVCSIYQYSYLSAVLPTVLFLHSFIVLLMANNRNNCFFFAATSNRFVTSNQLQSIV